MCIRDSNNDVNYEELRTTTLRFYKHSIRAKAVSYTHLDVYKRQLQLPRANANCIYTFTVI